MRKRIFEIIEVAKEDDRASYYYDAFMMAMILLSMVPLVFKQTTPLLIALDVVTVAVFMVDYLLRWSTADYKFQKPGLLLNAGFKVLRLLRLMRALRVFRVLRVVRYSKSLKIIGNVLKGSRESLLAVGSLAVAYILISALVIFNAEPDSFYDFFEAIYWATVLLTTVGYGDIYPVTTAGRLVAMASSIFGIAIVALPAGIITAGYMKELEKKKDE